MTALRDSAEQLTALVDYARPETDVPRLVERAADLLSQRTALLEELVVAEPQLRELAPDGTPAAREKRSELRHTVLRLRVRLAELSVEEAYLLTELESEAYWAGERQALAHTVAA